MGSKTTNNPDERMLKPFQCPIEGDKRYFEPYEKGSKVKSIQKHARRHIDRGQGNTCLIKLNKQLKEQREFLKVEKLRLFKEANCDKPIAVVKPFTSPKTETNKIVKVIAIDEIEDKIPSPIPLPWYPQVKPKVKIDPSIIRPRIKKNTTIPSNTHDEKVYIHQFFCFLVKELDIENIKLRNAYEIYCIWLEEEKGIKTKIKIQQDFKNIVNEFQGVSTYEYKLGWVLDKSKFLL